MAVIYIDTTIEKNNDVHPCLVIDVKHPCYRMVREAIDGKSVFHWSKVEAHKMYEWYCEGWKRVSLEDEFGEEVSEYTFKDILKRSHYMVKKNTPSEETIEDMWKAKKMQERIMESTVQDNEEEV